MLGAIAINAHQSVAAPKESMSTLTAAYNNAIATQNCPDVEILLKKMLQLEPNQAYPLLGIQYQKGICRDQDDQKSIEAYQGIPLNQLDSIYALHLKRLLFSTAKNQERKQQALSGIREIFYDFLLLVHQADELEKLVWKIMDDQPAFLAALQEEFAFFHNIDKDPTLKLTQAQLFLKTKQNRTLARLWLEQLFNEQNPRAAYLYAEYFDGALKEASQSLVFAAKNNIVEAQVALAKIYAQKTTAVGDRFAYYWFLKAAQNGGNVASNIAPLKARLSKVDIETLNDEALKEDSVYR